MRSRLALMWLTAGITACASAPSGSRIAQLEQARQANPASRSTLRSLGIAYYKAGRYSDARPALVEATRLDPNDGTSALFLGMASEKLGDIAAARTAYTTYLSVGKTSRVRHQLQSRLALLTRLELQASAKAAVARERELSVTPGAPHTVAVMPMHFTGSDSSLQPLERGFADLLITDLARSSQITVVERGRLQALLDEIALQQSGAADSATIVRAGKILQAGRVVEGAIGQRATQLRVDAAVIDVPTTSIAGTTSGDGNIDDLFALEKVVAFGVFRAMSVTLTEAERQAIEQRPTRSLQAFLAYSRGLTAEDAGRFDDAARQFDEAVRLDPSFTRATAHRESMRSAQVGSATSVTSVESSLRGTREGAMADAAAEGGASGTLGVTLQSTADQINPNPNAPAAGGAAGTSTVQVQKDGAAEATRQDNPASRLGTVVIIIKRP
jgi:TolB-like protein